MWVLFPTSPTLHLPKQNSWRETKPPGRGPQAKEQEWTVGAQGLDWILELPHSTRVGLKVISSIPLCHEQSFNQEPRAKSWRSLTDIKLNSHPLELRDQRDRLPKKAVPTSAERAKWGNNQGWGLYCKLVAVLMWAWWGTHWGARSVLSTCTDTTPFVCGPGEGPCTYKADFHSWPSL